MTAISRPLFCPRMKVSIWTWRQGCRTDRSGHLDRRLGRALGLADRISGTLSAVPVNVDDVHNMFGVDLAV